jgi:hypothetical protein
MSMGGASQDIPKGGFQIRYPKTATRNCRPRSSSEPQFTKSSSLDIYDGESGRWTEARLPMARALNAAAGVLGKPGAMVTVYIPNGAHQELLLIQSPVTDAPRLMTFPSLPCRSFSSLEVKYERCTCYRALQAGATFTRIGWTSFACRPRMAPRLRNHREIRATRRAKTPPSPDAREFEISVGSAGRPPRI